MGWIDVFIRRPVLTWMVTLSMVVFGVAIGAGRPAGLLLERLAAAAANRGVPLWVPNVDSAALKLVLSQPGTIWVDGPAVPTAEP